MTGALPTVNICDSVFFWNKVKITKFWQREVEKRSWNQLVSASGKEERGTELRVAKSPVTGNEQTVHFYNKKALWEHIDHIKQELFDDRNDQMREDQGTVWCSGLNRQRLWSSLQSALVWIPHQAPFIAYHSPPFPISPHYASNKGKNAQKINLKKCGRIRWWCMKKRRRGQANKVTKATAAARVMRKCNLQSILYLL